jgi:tetratricopeptide (TPR) repeat protein/serine/threonine protein kinase
MSTPSSDPPTRTIDPVDRPTDTHPIAHPTASDQTRVAGDCPPAAVAPPGYELLGEVGRGGMGMVYRARDRSLDRDVAVKLLQDRYPAGSPAARRFTGEARITAQLQHPGIPAVHQVGTLPDGRPFLAMKLIRGRTLDDLLKERPAPSADRGRFLAVFEQVCQAVGYAHAHKVIHRDLKPSNVMVGAFGEVQVMDWGLAKVLAGGGHQLPEPRGDPDATLGTEVRSARGADLETQAGSLLGTPAYMAPEQASGAVDRIDARSDVFGLGGVLCAILTGKPPYVGETAESTRQLAARAKLDDAHARLAGCGAEPELVGLCLRCLAAEPDDRPRDAGAVADAVHRLRADAEDRARRAELDRARAEVQAAEQRKRRRVQGALAAAVLGAAVLAASGGWWLDRQATARETERQVAAARDREAAALALDQAEAALGKDNPVYGEIDAALVQAEKRLAGGGPGDLRERLAELTKARRMLDRLDAIDVRRWSASSDHPRNLDAASARAAYPAAFRDYGLDVAAEPPEVLAGKVRGSPIAARLTAAVDDWLEVGGPAALLEVAGHLDPDPGRAALRRALAAGDGAAIAGRVAGLDGGAVSPAFAAFVGGHERTPEADAERLFRSAQAAHPDHFTLAMQAALRSSRADDKVGYYRIALALRPANVACHNNLGIALYDKGDVDGAIDAYREAIRLDPGYVPAHNNLGNALRAKKDLDGAVAAYREAIRLDPGSAPAHSNLGTALGARGEVDAAVAAYREAIRLDPKYALAHSNLGNALAAKGEVDAAVAAYKEAIRLDPKYARAHYNLGNALYDKRDVDGAIAAYREAIRLDPGYASAHYNLGNALSAKEDVDGAIAELREAIRLDPGHARAHNNLGNALSAKKDVGGAIAAYTEAVRLKINHPPTYTSLAELLARRGEPRAALDVLRQGAEVDPGWLTDPTTGFRYDSARYACRAAARRGKDAPSSAERPALRRQALDWLTADLAAWRERLAADPPKNRAAVHGQMAHWLADSDLAAVREPSEVVKLPLDEWVGWARLWTAVRELRDATAPPEVAPPPRPAK